MWILGEFHKSGVRANRDLANVIEEEAVTDVLCPKETYALVRPRYLHSAKQPRVWKSLMTHIARRIGRKMYLLLRFF